MTFKLEELENYTKKTHFPVFAKNVSQAMDEVEIFFANFQILGPLGCQGWVAIPQNVKKPKSLHPSVEGIFSIPCLIIQRLHFGWAIFR